MQELHPAACERCCKQIAEPHRRLPEALSESLYLCGQATVLAASFVMSLFIGLAFVLLAISGQYGWNTSSQQTRARAKALRESKEAQCKRIEHLHSRDIDKHIVYQQHVKLEAAEYKLRWGSNDETVSAAKALASLQQEHDDYVNQVHVRSHRYDLEKDQPFLPF